MKQNTLRRTKQLAFNNCLLITALKNKTLTDCEAHFYSQNKGREARFLLIGIVLLLIFALSAQAQQSPSSKTATKVKTVDFANVVEQLLANNPSLKVFPLRKHRLEAGQQRSALRPAYQLGVSLDNFAGNKTYRDFSGAELSTSLSSVFELGGKRAARVAVGEQQLDVLVLQQQVKALDLLSTLSRRYIQQLANQQRLLLLKQEQQLAEQMLSEVKQRAEAGATADVEVKRAKANLIQSKIRLNEQRQTLHLGLLKLASMWGENNPNFQQVSGDLYHFDTLPKLTELNQMVQHSVWMQALEAEQELAEKQLNLAATDNQTNLNWSLAVKRFQDTDDYGLNAGFSLPLWSKKRNQANIIEARSKYHESLLLQQNSLFDLRSRLNQLYLLRKHGINRFRLLNEQLIPVLSDTLSEMQRGYQNGRFSYLELILSRQELIDSKAKMIDLAENILLYSSEIEQLTAQSLPQTTIQELK